MEEFYIFFKKNSMRDTLKNNISILILCGGRGSRIKSVTLQPKCLLNVNGEIFLGSLIKQLQRIISTEIFLATGYKSDSIKEYIEDNKINSKIIKENYPLGTGGALKNASRFIQSKKILLINGDTIISSNDLKSFITQQSSKPLMLAVTDDIGESRYGFICEEKHLKIVKSKKTRKKYIFAGIALIEASLLDNYNKEVFSFEDFINDIRLEESHYDLHLFTEKFIDFGTPESYLNLKST